MNPATSHRAESNRDVKEVRIGIVCYGGISLAVYMHGYTKELQKLVAASEAFHAHDSASNPFCDACVESVYWEALQALHQSQSRTGEDLRLRVVVDVIAGASAGGINGIFLGKALAHNRPLDPLRDLWFEHADLKALTGGSWLSERWHAIRLLQGQAPFDGKALYEWLYGAVQTMDSATGQSGQAHSASCLNAAGQSSPPSLMPGGHKLELFVTMSDYFGFNQLVAVDDPPFVSEQEKRHVMKLIFDADAGKDHFTAEHNPLLAFCARATSSFPLVFPPADVSRMNELLDAPGSELSAAAARAEFFPAYVQANADPRDTFFIDGGVLNDKPFEQAIGAIVSKRAEAQVDRYLLYLEPDPNKPVAPKNCPQTPSSFDTGWAGLTAMGNSQPIVDALLDVRDFNERARLAQSIIQHQGPKIRDRIDELKGYMGATLEELLADPSIVLAELRRQAGYLYDGYLQVRASSVIDQFGAVLCDLNQTPRSSETGYIVQLIVEQWAKSRLYPDCKASGAGSGAPIQGNSDPIQGFLDQFDVGYSQRRLAFLISVVNEWYESPNRLDRLACNRAKGILYDGIEDLEKLSNGAGLDEMIVGGVAGLFKLADLGGKTKNRDPAARVRDFLAAHGAALDKAAGALGPEILHKQNEIDLRIYHELRRLWSDWSQEHREQLEISYVGFPYWDVLIFPVIRLSHAGELREMTVIRCSSADSVRLDPGGAKAKLKGVGLGHFEAFLKEAYRENDYLWGRLDAAERLLDLLARSHQPPAAPCDPQGSAANAAATLKDSLYRRAFAAILAEEESSLKAPESAALIAKLRQKLGAAQKGAVS